MDDNEKEQLEQDVLKKHINLEYPVTFLWEMQLLSSLVLCAF